MYEDGWLGRAWIRGYVDGYHKHGVEYLNIRDFDYRSGWEAGLKDQERGRPMYVKPGKQGDLFCEGHE